MESGDHASEFAVIVPGFLQRKVSDGMRLILQYLSQRGFVQVPASYRRNIFTFI
jgi:hypothetical protein